MPRQIDYNAISRVYDQVRGAEADLIHRLLLEIEGLPAPQVLDIGCGTGTYAHALQQLIEGQVVGVDPSHGMLAQARQKDGRVSFRTGDAGRLPCPDAVFDLAYMTDVIHHVPDLAAFCAEAHRVLKPGGKLCIITQSHAQIAARPIARFFPGTVAVDQVRYPDIAAIVAAAARQGLALLDVESFGADADVLDQRFLALVRAKGYSMLHLLDDAAYAEGLAQLEAALAQGELMVRRAGQTLVRLQK